MNTLEHTIRDIEARLTLADLGNARRTADMLDAAMAQLTAQWGEVSVPEYGDIVDSLANLVTK